MSGYHKTLILCAIATLAALITCTIRHEGSGPALLTFYVTGYCAPFILLAFRKHNRPARHLQNALLIIPIGIAIGCWLMSLAPTGQPDGKVMGWAILTAIWCLILTPVCLIPLCLTDKPSLPPIPMHSLNFRQATPFDLPTLRNMYDEIIDAMDKSTSHAQWHRGGYPTDAFLQTRAAIGELWVAEQNNTIIAAMVLNAECNPGYAQADWQVTCEPHEVMAIHTLGVSPRVQGQGVGKAMVQQAIAVARRKGCKCMRLDVIDTNPAAGQFYTRLGFSFLGRYELNYPGTVCTDFDLYELPL